MTIDTSQNVGIGTSSPTAKLDIQGGSIAVGTTTAGNSTVGMTFGKVAAGGGTISNRITLATYGGSYGAYMEAYADLSASTATYLALGTQAGGGGTPTERMRITSDGNVGIGTSSPNFNGATGTVCHVNNSNANAWALSHYTNGTTGSGAADGFLVGYTTDGANAYLFNYESAAILFGTSGAERVRIDSSGNLLVGTTTAFAKVVSSNTTWCYQAENTSDGNLIRFSKNGTSVGSVTTNGTSTSYNTSSDYRLKENVQPMQGALDVVSQLKPVTYTWKADKSDGQGFIAHELQSVMPECVTGEKDAVDEDGNPIYQGIDTSFLVATLTAAIQELNAKVDAQAAEIAKLKGAA
jgi:hypothetical protein